MIEELEALRLSDGQRLNTIAQLEQELVNLRRGARIDREATEQVREGVVSSEAKIASLQQELAFYRGLMAPTATEQGLGIRSLSLYEGSGEAVYRYQLIIQQLALKHRLLQGEVRMSLRGLQGGDEKVLSLGELSLKGGAATRAFRFRYFERLDGQFILPEGFQPLSVDVVAKTREKRPRQVEKRFDWQLVEE